MRYFSRLDHAKQIAHALLELGRSIHLPHAKARYVMAALIMTGVLAAMSAYLGSLIPFGLIVFGQFALFLTVRLSGIFIPAVVTAVCGVLISISLPWEMLHAMVPLATTPALIMLSLAFSCISFGPYWLLEIAAEVAQQIHILEDDHE